MHPAIAGLQGVEEEIAISWSNLVPDSDRETDTD